MIDSQPAGPTQRMAKAADVKAPQLLSESFDADDEGWLDKLIADEDEPERATLWRLGSWAIAAVVALTLGLMSGQLPEGAKRADVAEAEIATQAQQLAGLARETKQETRRIAAALETLNSDRDRLFNRVAAVEQNLDSVTGSIAKQATVAKPAEPTLDKPAERAIAAATADPAPAQPSAVAASPDAKPEVKQDTKKDPSAKDTPKGASQQAAPVQTAPAQMPAAQLALPPDTAKKADRKADRSDGQRAAAPTAAAEAETTATSPAPATQPSAAQAQMTQGSMAQDSTTQGAEPASTTTVAKKATSQQAVPASPMVITAAPLTPLPEDEVAAAAEPETPVDRTQFGLDLGGASSMTGLRTLWSGVRKAHPSQFAALRPVLAIRPGKNGLGLQVHVVAGPIPDAAAAARLCAILAADDRGCETAVFDGQRLLPDADDAKKRPAAPRSARRKQARQEPAPTPPAPPPADSNASVLSLLGVR